MLCPAFIAFSISLIVLVVLILHKMWEMKKGHTFISKAVLPKSDSLLKKHIELHKEVIVVGGKRGIKALSSVTKESMKHFFLVVAHYLHDKLTQAIVKVRGKSMKHKSGVSFFLKRMGDFKKEDKSVAQKEVAPDALPQEKSQENKVEGQL